jgi:hypothetical protein
MSHLKIVNADEGYVHKYENEKRKLYRCNASIFFDQQCLKIRPLWLYCRNTMAMSRLKMTVLIYVASLCCQNTSVIQRVLSTEYLGSASLFMGAQLGDMEWACLLGTLRDRWKGFWKWGVSLCGGSVKGTWWEGPLPGGPRAVSFPTFVRPRPGK